VLYCENLRNLWIAGLFFVGQQNGHYHFGDGFGESNFLLFGFIQGDVVFVGIDSLDVAQGILECGLSGRPE
jgi:hypothetical protein